MSDLMFRQQAVWREAVGLSPREVNKKVVTYQSWCGMSFACSQAQLCSFASVLVQGLGPTCDAKCEQVQTARPSFTGRVLQMAGWLKHL